MAFSVRLLGAGRTRWACVVLLAACAGVAGTSRVAASGIETVIDRDSGEVFLQNTAAAFEPLDGYSFVSPGSSLLPSAWTTVADEYDVSGDMSVDASAEWFVIAETNDTLAEASTDALSGGLTAGEIVSLGPVWSVGGFEALAVTLSAGSSTTFSVGDFRDLAADYDNDLDVDLDDLSVFTATLGSTTLLAADGNGDGVIDAADYTVWRDSPELSLNAATAAFLEVPMLLPPIAVEIGFDGPAASVVPEPSSLTGSMAATLVAALRRRRRR